MELGDFLGALDDLRASLRKNKALNVNRKELRENAKDVVKSYFRECRPRLIKIGFQDSDLADLDGAMQKLLGTANGNNRLQSYLDIIDHTRSVVVSLEGDAEIRHSKVAAAPNSPRATPVEAAILATLQAVLPSASLSYRQAIHDLSAENRVSYRGTANELRECLREVLDHFAPDEKVMAQPGFAPEKDQRRPTQKQKVRYILRRREMSATAIAPAENSVKLADELTAAVTRSASERSSLSAHISHARGEVAQMKMYIDSVLTTSSMIEQHFDVGTRQL